MAANPPHMSHVIDCPPSRHDGIGRGQATTAPRERNPARRKLCVFFSWILVAAATITGLVLMVVFLARKFPLGDPVFSVAVAGVAGLDDTATTTTTLSPEFNLTFHIDNARNSAYRACVPGLSSAAVSYGGAALANGTVPPFCAGKKRESERVAATARGDAVALPRPLRDQLAGELAAGEAAVDVNVTMPRYCQDGWCADAVLSCKAKIGGALSRCRLDHIQPQSQGEDSSQYAPVMFFFPNPIPGMPPIMFFG